MLRINKVTYRIGARVLLDAAEATINPGHRVGLVGRNGTGKSTLLRMIAGELEPQRGPDRAAAALAGRHHQPGSAGRRAQPDRDGPAHRRRTGAPERRSGERHRSAPHRRDPHAAARQGRPLGRGAGGPHPRRARLLRSGAAAAVRRILRRLADARRARRAVVQPAGPAAARRADQPPRSGSQPVAGGLSARLPRHGAAGQPRSRSAQPGGRARSCISTAAS